MKNQLITTLCLLVILMSSCKEAKPKEEATKAPAADAVTTKLTAVEFEDAKYADILRTGQAAFSHGDISTYMNMFADNAVYAWGNLDSLAGKQAISDYWTKRRDQHIDTVHYSNQVFIPIKINQPQANEASGIWVLNWYTVDATYLASGKKMTQWVHLDAHFNADAKIDRIVQYIDRAKVNEAMKK